MRALRGALAVACCCAAAVQVPPDAHLVPAAGKDLNGKFADISETPTVDWIRSELARRVAALKAAQSSPQGQQEVGQDPKDAIREEQVQNTIGSAPASASPNENLYVRFGAKEATATEPPVDYSAAAPATLPPATEVGTTIPAAAVTDLPPLPLFSTDAPVTMDMPAPPEAMVGGATEATVTAAVEPASAEGAPAPGTGGVAERADTPTPWSGEPNLVIIVLGYRRMVGIKQLLDSLEATDYDGDQVALEVWVDKVDKNPSLSQNVGLAANNVTWTHGPKAVHVRDRNVGLRDAWVHTWDTQRSSYEYALILEDDLVVSPLWYKWLRGAITAYGQAPEVGALCIAHNNRRPQLQMADPTAPYLYKGLKSWGFVAKKKVWGKFQEFVKKGGNGRGKDFNKNWEPWWVDFAVKQEGLYMLHANAPSGSLCSMNHQNLPFDEGAGIHGLLMSLLDSSAQQLSQELSQELSLVQLGSAPAVDKVEAKKIQSYAATVANQLHQLLKLAQPTDWEAINRFPDISTLGKFEDPVAGVMTLNPSANKPGAQQVAGSEKAPTTPPANNAGAAPISAQQAQAQAAAQAAAPAVGAGPASDMSRGQPAVIQAPAQPVQPTPALASSADQNLADTKISKQHTHFQQTGQGPKKAWETAPTATVYTSPAMQAAQAAAAAAAADQQQPAAAPGSDGFNYAAEAGAGGGGSGSDTPVPAWHALAPATPGDTHYEPVQAPAQGAPGSLAPEPPAGIAAAAPSFEPQSVHAHEHESPPANTPPEMGAEVVMKPIVHGQAVPSKLAKKASK